MPPKARPLQERFWEKVDVRAVDECWPWLASRTTGGYGTFSISHDYTTQAIRVAYELVKGTIPDGLEVHHACNNGHLGCTNPYHMEAVTKSYNRRAQDKCCRKCGGPYDRIRLKPDGSFKQRSCSKCHGNRGVPADPGAARKRS